MSARDVLLAALPTTEPGATYDDLEQVTGRERREWHETLGELVKEGAVHRVGKGAKGSPYRYWRAPTDSLGGFLGDAHKESKETEPEAIPCVPFSSRREEAHGIALEGTPPADSLAAQNGKLPTAARQAAFDHVQRTFPGSTWEDAGNAEWEAGREVETWDFTQIAPPGAGRAAA